MGALKLYQEEAGLHEQERVADIFTWDDSPREFHGVEGPRGFASYREAVEASRFLVSFFESSVMGDHT